jgi:hypothetical protein
MYDWDLQVLSIQPACFIYEITNRNWLKLKTLFWGENLDEEGKNKGSVVKTVRNSQTELFFRQDKSNVK